MDTERCNECHHLKPQHVPVCTDAMLGAGRYCDCGGFVAPDPAPEQQEASPVEAADPAAEQPDKVRRPAVRSRAR